jgi:osmotically-inducible protein OsmY
VLEKELDAEVATERTLEEAEPLLDPRTLAVLLVGPEATPASIRWVRQRTEPGSAPCFAVMPKRIADERARSLYKAGAQAVFEWPKEALVIPEIVEQALGCGLRQTRAPGTAADRRMAAAIRARLQIAPEPGDDISVAVNDGVAKLDGEVARLRRKDRINRAIADLPGVRRVDSSELIVSRSGVDDAEIRRSTRAIIARVAPEDGTSVATRVKNQEVTIAGSVSSRAELESIAEMIASLPGVRRIHNMLVITPHSRQDPQVLRRIRNTVRRAFPDDDVAISVFGPVAVLSGRVDRLKHKWDIEHAVRASDRIDHVVNKLEIR